jgi:hypothetical protein
MTAPNRYAGVPGFDLGTDNTPAPNPLPNRAQSLRENDELVSDLARFSEGILTEKQIRKKWHLLNESAWVALGEDNLMIEMVEAEQVRRIRNGASKRELAQLHVVRGPAVLATIMDDPRANHRHKVDAVKALDALADNGPQSAPEAERIVIKIDLGADVRAQGREPNPSDVIIIDAEARPSKQIEEDHSDEWRR